MHISQTATASLKQSHKLTIFHDITQELSGLSIISHCTTWHINNLTFSVSSRTFVDTTILTITGKYVALVFKMEQSPIITVSTQDDITTLSTITTIGTAIGYIFSTMQVSHSTAATTRTTHNLYIINKVRFRHKKNNQDPHGLLNNTIQ